RDAVAGLQGLAHGEARTTSARRLRDEARAALASTPRDVNGRRWYEFYGPYLLWYQNLDLTNGTNWSATVRTEQMERAVVLAIGAHARLSGIHLDSTSGMRRWGAADDYDRSHWAAATIPLTFSYDSGQVVERGIFPMFGEIVRSADFAHARGMLLSANFNGDEARALSFVGADQIDFFGLEQGLQDRATKDVSADQFAMLKRTMADQRPVSTLDHKVGRGLVSTAEVERRLQQNLFYGIFMGAWNARVEADGGSAWPTWTDPADTALWSRYAALFRELASAGWQPVTDARSSNPNVWVERFGSLADRSLRLTLRNETPTEQDTTITVDLSPAGLGPAPSLRGFEELTRSDV